LIQIARPSTANGPRLPHAWRPGWSAAARPGRGRRWG